MTIDLLTKTFYFFFFAFFKEGYFENSSGGRSSLLNSSTLPIPFSFYSMERSLLEILD